MNPALLRYGDYGGRIDAMGRVRAPLESNGTKLWTLFDTGARNSYILKTEAAPFGPRPIPIPRTVGLGGKTRTLSDICLVVALLEGRQVEFEAYVVDELGMDDGGRPIQILFGALAMQKWGVRPIPDEERLDLTHFSEEFNEF